MDGMQLAGREDRSVAVVAFGRDFVAPPPRIPGMVGPFDFGRHAREDAVIARACMRKFTA